MWMAKINKYTNKYCEIFRKREGVKFQPTKIYLHVEDADGNVITDQDDWDTELNQFLLENKIKAKDQENEKVRFGLMLKESLKKPEIKFGDGYYNSVLLEIVIESFKGYGDVDDKLSSIVISGTPSKVGSSYSECRSMIIGEIVACANNLTKLLSYNRKQADEILAGAIGYYLDDRFSVTTRKLLGFG